jgi:hypothetical protein
MDRIITKFKEIYKKLKEVVGKAKKALGFIDFLIHDILDHSLLMNKSDNFVKNSSIFNPGEAVEEIVDLMSIKAKAKDV